jgi:hypothetical protein
MVEPAGASARAEVLLFGDEGRGWFAECAGRLCCREEVDVDAADATGAELDVAGSAAVVGGRLRTVSQGREQGGGNHSCRALCEDSSLWDADRGDVTDGVHTRESRLQCLRLTGM